MPGDGASATRLQKRHLRPMRLVPTMLVALSFALPLAFATAGAASDSSMTDRYIVSFQSGVSAAQQAAALEQAGAVEVSGVRRPKDRQGTRRAEAMFALWIRRAEAMFALWIRAGVWYC
jgi:hypothetical protein